MTLGSTAKTVTMLTPASLAKPLGRYSHLSLVRARELVAVAGQVSVDIDGNFVGEGDVIAQAKQAYENVRSALQTIGLDMHHIWRLNAYVVGADAIEQFMQARTEVYAEIFPDGTYPPITLISVSRLAFPELLVEIDALAAVPTDRERS